MAYLDQFWQDGKFMGPDDFRDPSVPGATGGVDPTVLQPAVDAHNEGEFQHRTAQVNDDTAANAIAATELTDAQKAAEEQRKAGIDLEKAKLAEQKAALDRADKEAGLGMRPEPEAPVDEPSMEFTEEQAAAGEAAYEAQVEASQTPEQLMATGEKMMSVGQARLGGVNAKIDKDTAEATETFAIRQAGAANLQMKREAAQRAEAEKRFSEIDTQIQSVIDRGVKKPTPSALNLLGVFLGGLIAPMNGGKNVAMEALERQMEREISVDQENRAKELQGLRTRKGVLTDELAEQGKADIAADIKRSQWHTAMYNETIAWSQKDNLPAKQKAASMIQAGEHKLKAGQAASRAKIAAAKASETERHNRAMEEAKRAKVGTGKGKGKGKVTPPALVIDALKEMGIDRKDINRVGAIEVTDRDGKRQTLFLGVVGTSVMSEFNKAAPVFVRSMEKTGDIVKLVNQPGIAYTTPIGSTGKGAEIATAYYDFLLGMKEVTNLGVLNGKDLDVLQSITGLDPTAIRNLTPKNIQNHLKVLYGIMGKDLNAKVSRYSGQTSKYEYPTWESIIKDASKARGRTNKELNIQLDTVISERGERDEGQVASAQNEVAQIADELLGQGISTANIEEAEKMLAKLEKLNPAERRGPMEEDGADRHLQLSTAIQNWKSKGMTDVQATVQSRQRKSLADAEKTRALRKRLSESAKKAPMNR